MANMQVHNNIFIWIDFIFNLLAVIIISFKKIQNWPCVGSEMNQKKIREPPKVTGLSPKEGPPGTKITIRGENLGSMQRTYMVSSVLIS